MNATAPVSRLRVLTLNAWALPIAVPGQDKRARTARLPDALRAVDADVIVLQETFDASVRSRVVDSLRDQYHVAHDALHIRRTWGVTFDVHGGILVLSRFDLGETRFEPHPLPPGSKLSERLGRKGTVFTTVKTPIGDLTLVAPHFYAGTSPADERIRRLQVEALLEAIEKLDNGPMILAGDLNFPPERYDDGRASEMDLIVAAGFRDTIDPSNGHQTATWSYSRNRYARNWLQSNKSDMRFDYVMLRANGASNLETVGASVVLDAPGEEVSDHYGVLAEFSLGWLGWWDGILALENRRF